MRDLSWVMHSLERLYRDNAFEHSRLVNMPAERATVYTRLDALAGANRLVGYAWHALREATLLAEGNGEADTITFVTSPMGATIWVKRANDLNLTSGENSHSDPYRINAAEGLTIIGDIDLDGIPGITLSNINRRRRFFEIGADANFLI